MNIMVIVFIFSIIPLVRLAWLGVHDQLGANPVEFVIRSLGTWTLIFLLLTLAMTPVRRWFGVRWPMQIRRMLGLFSFFYAFLHLLAYAGLDLWFDWNTIMHDVIKHPYVMLGFAAFLLILPLAVTSNSFSMRSLGKRWGQLHRLVYPAAILAVMHFLWLVKRDLTEPLIFAAVFILLLSLRSNALNVALATFCSRILQRVRTHMLGGNQRQDSALR